MMLSLHLILFQYFMTKEYKGALQAFCLSRYIVYSKNMIAYYWDLRSFVHLYVLRLKIVKMYSIKEVNSNIQNLRTVKQDNFAVNVCKSL